MDTTDFQNDSNIVTSFTKFASAYSLLSLETILRTYWINLYVHASGTYKIYARSPAPRQAFA